MAQKGQLIELKLIFCRGENIGKTTFLFSFFRGKLSLHLEESLKGENLFRKELIDVSQLLSNYAIKIWDIAGDEQFHGIFPIFTEFMDGIVLIIGKNDRIDQTIEKWVTKINKFFTTKTPRYLIGLQKDDEYFDPAHLNEMKIKFNFDDLFILNASYSIEIRNSFKYICLC